MAQNNPEQEPSIEEILASIRQIISDDDEEETVAEPEPAPKPKAKVKPAPEPEPEPEPEEDEDDEVLELTDKLDQPEEDEDEDEDDFVPEPPRVEIDLQDSDDYDDNGDDDDEDSLLTDSAQHAVFEGISALASKTALDRKGTGATTIEDIVREMMKPMLREWLDVHLPPLIEKIVQRELRKVARRAMEDEE